MTLNNELTKIEPAYKGTQANTSLGEPWISANIHVTGAHVPTPEDTAVLALQERLEDGMLNGGPAEQAQATSLAIGLGFHEPAGSTTYVETNIVDAALGGLEQDKFFAQFSGSTFASAASGSLNIQPINQGFTVEERVKPQTPEGGSQPDPLL